MLAHSRPLITAEPTISGDLFRMARNKKRSGPELFGTFRYLFQLTFNLIQVGYLGLQFPVHRVQRKAVRERWEGKEEWQKAEREKRKGKRQGYTTTFFRVQQLLTGKMGCQIVLVLASFV